MAKLCKKNIVFCCILMLQTMFATPTQASVENPIEVVNLIPVRNTEPLYIQELVASMKGAVSREDVRLRNIWCIDDSDTDCRMRKVIEEATARYWSEGKDSTTIICNGAWRGIGYSRSSMIKEFCDRYGKNPNAYCMFIDSDDCLARGMVDFMLKPQEDYGRSEYYVSIGDPGLQMFFGKCPETPGNQEYRIQCIPSPNDHPKFRAHTIKFREDGRAEVGDSGSAGFCPVMMNVATARLCLDLELDAGMQCLLTHVREGIGKQPDKIGEQLADISGELNAIGQRLHRMGTQFDKLRDQLDDIRKNLSADRPFPMYIIHGPVLYFYRCVPNSHWNKEKKDDIFAVRDTLLKAYPGSCLCRWCDKTENCICKTYKDIRKYFTPKAFRECFLSMDGTAGFAKSLWDMLPELRTVGDRECGQGGFDVALWIINVAGSLEPDQIEKKLWFEFIGYANLVNKSIGTSDLRMYCERAVKFANMIQERGFQRPEDEKFRETLIFLSQCIVDQINNLPFKLCKCEPCQIAKASLQDLRSKSEEMLGKLKS